MLEKDGWERLLARTLTVFTKNHLLVVATPRFFPTQRVRRHFSILQRRRNTLLIILTRSLTINLQMYTQCCKITQKGLIFQHLFVPHFLTLLNFLGARLHKKNKNKKQLLPEICKVRHFLQIFKHFARCEVGFWKDFNYWRDATKNDQFYYNPMPITRDFFGAFFALHQFHASEKRVISIWQMLIWVGLYLFATMYSSSSKCRTHTHISLSWYLLQKFGAKTWSSRLMSF